MEYPGRIMGSPTRPLGLAVATRRGTPRRPAELLGNRRYLDGLGRYRDRSSRESPAFVRLSGRIWVSGLLRTTFSLYREHCCHVARINTYRAWIPGYVHKISGLLIRYRHAISAIQLAIAALMGTTFSASSGISSNFRSLIPKYL